MNTGFSKIIILFTAGVLAALSCIGLLLVSSLVSQERIYANTCQSAEYYLSVPLFEDIMDSQPAVRRDNYADCITTSIAYFLGDTTDGGSRNRANPFLRILEAGYARGDRENVNAGLYRALKSGDSPDRSYSRYWHGNAAVIRLLLSFFTARQIRWIALIAGIILNLSFFVYLAVKKEYILSISCFTGILAGKLFFGYGCFEYSFVCFLFPVLSFAVYLCFDVYTGKRKEAGRDPDTERKKLEVIIEGIFLAGGVLTCFFDFLTAETLTFTVPAFIMLVCLKKADAAELTIFEAGVPKNNKKTVLGNGLVSLLKTGICWLVGYGGMFGLKWMLVFLFLGKEEFATSMDYLAVRTVGEVHETLSITSPIVGWFDRLRLLFLRNLSCLFSFPDTMSEKAVTVALAGVGVALFLLWFFLRKTEKDKSNSYSGRSVVLPMILLALLPAARFLVLSNHAYIHYFFTYRALMVTVMIVIYGFLQSTILSGFIKK